MGPEHGVDFVRKRPRPASLSILRIRPGNAQNSSSVVGAGSLERTPRNRYAAANMEAIAPIAIGVR